MRLQYVPREASLTALLTRGSYSDDRVRGAHHQSEEELGGVEMESCDKAQGRQESARRACTPAARHTQVTVRKSLVEPKVDADRV